LYFFYHPTHTCCLPYAFTNAFTNTCLSTRYHQLLPRACAFTILTATSAPPAPAYANTAHARRLQRTPALALSPVACLPSARHIFCGAVRQHHRRGDRTLAHMPLLLPPRSSASACLAPPRKHAPHARHASTRATLRRRPLHAHPYARSAPAATRTRIYLRTLLSLAADNSWFALSFPFWTINGTGG